MKREISRRGFVIGGAYAGMAAATGAFMFSPSAAFAAGVTRIHVMAFTDMDAIVLESSGRFAMVDSGEDSTYPSGSDARYPWRDGITKGNGHENEVISYLHSLGATESNFEFYLGTHPHSDHIGSASQVINEFRPKRVYTPEYNDSYITDSNALWDNQYCYDRLVEAAHNVGATLITSFDTSAPIDPVADASAAQRSASVETDPSAGTDAPAAESLSREDIIERFGVDPTDPHDPNNSSELPDGRVRAVVPASPNERSVASNSQTTGNPVFSLGAMTIEVMNYGDDYKLYGRPDCNWFSLGVKVSAYGKTAFLAGDINNYDGDEDRLASLLGHVDFLKTGHHGFWGSNTTNYLHALSPRYAVQTGPYDRPETQVLEDFCDMGTKFYTTPDVAAEGYQAVIATFNSSELQINVADDSTHYRMRSLAPAVVRWGGHAGVASTGWEYIEGAWYYFDGHAYAMHESWKEIDGNWYFFGEDSKMVTGWVDWDGWYHTGADGIMQTGWQKIKDDWYCFDETGLMLSDAWSGNYWLGHDGAMARDQWVDDGHYYVGADGAWVPSRTRPVWRSDTVGWWLEHPDGSYPQNTWEAVDGSWYYFSALGYVASGWQQVGGLWFYLNPDHDGNFGVMQTGWQNIAGSWYHFDSSGAMETGWIDDSGLWYYLREDGTMATGWLYCDGSWYYLKEDGSMARGWHTFGGAWYLFSSSGAMQVGWRQDDGAWYFFSDSGVMQTGWVDDVAAGKSYHLRSDGTWDGQSRAL